MDKEQVIKKYIENNLSKSAVAKELGVSRERIGQIIAEVYGTRNPIVNYAGQIDWKLFNQIAKVFGISMNVLSRKAKCNPHSVRHILINDKKWVKNVRRSKNNVSVKIAKAILDIAQKRLERLNKVLEKLVIQL